METIIKKRYPRYEMIAFTSNIEDLKVIYHLLDGALEMYECEKPGHKETIASIKRIMYKIDYSIKSARTIDETKKFDVLLLGKEINLINRIDAKNIFGSQIQIY